MKLLKYTVALGALSSVASAQGLFDVNPNEIESEASPLRYNVGVALGYDDNVNPTNSLPEQSSLYVRAHVGANLVVRGPRTSWDVNATVGQTRNFDVDSNTNSTNARLAFNINHRINDRTRFVSRNFANYGLDLGNFFGAITSRSADNFLFVSTDNAIGYRWTDRFATYTGITFSHLNYESGQEDVTSYGFYNQLRYILNSRTVLTSTYRYTNNSFDVSGDTDSHFASVGVERQLTDTSSVTFEGGVQFASSTSLFGQATYVNVISDRLRARAFARFSQEFSDTVFFNVPTNSFERYEDRSVFRVGGAIDYTLSPKIVLTAGANFTGSDFSDGTNGIEDADWDLFNIHGGITYRLTDAFSTRASINYTTSDTSNDSVIGNRDFNRTRYEVGVNYSF